MKKSIFFTVLTTSLLASSAVFAQVTKIPSDCNQCGIVTKIEKVSDAKSGTGGAIAGAVVGGLLGNQVGGGKGKTVATVAGAAGGAYGGKKIAEGNMEYEVTLKMKDGSVKVLRQEWLHDIKVGEVAKVKDNKTAKRYKP
jgi:outer membrane lipoprotein SlyB